MREYFGLPSNGTPNDDVVDDDVLDNGGRRPPSSQPLGPGRRLAPSYETVLRRVTAAAAAA